MTKLRIENINLDNDSIFIAAESSENKKDNNITIPKALKEDLSA